MGAPSVVSAHPRHRAVTVSEAGHLTLGKDDERGH